MGRKLRVDFSNETVSDDDNRDRDGGAGTSAPYSSYPNPSNGGGSGIPPPTSATAGTSATGSSSLPPLPQGKDLPPGVTCTDAISRTLNTLPPAQLLDILQQMKTLATADPARATELLSQAPQLGYAVFQALLIMGLVSPDAINSVLDPGAAAAGIPPPLLGLRLRRSLRAAVTRLPPQAAPALAPAAAAAGGQDPEALMRAVMELPQETIDQLPEAERQQIMALRASYAAQTRR